MCYVKKISVTWSIAMKTFLSIRQGNHIAFNWVDYILCRIIEIDMDMDIDGYPWISI